MLSRQIRLAQFDCKRIVGLGSIVMMVSVADCRQQALFQGILFKLIESVGIFANIFGRNRRRSG
jgi:hypothetical protein